ncbi:toxin-antitoxin system, toxin component [Bifidobacterium ramosum]|uniref:protein adenylyltransferase n=1 Tax=Bifidobacterium ramosum TaxID=1798158 RepID=A0A6L4X080_9BIFI|nr:Fic family protein [Bifidobacterium ramosum]KAB8287875.1 toxin-antitoxin system, toxin component [Bifidobacterium ramosum]NEG71176.1 cell filamentation protein Fic [Bifidobacterium ramosum]
MPDRFVDPYVDRRTGILCNLVGATTYDELQNAEGEFVALRMNEFFTRPIPPMSGSLDDFRMLHRILFQDIYDWAGEIRTVEIRKNVEGAEFFLPSTNIAMGVGWARGELRKDNMLVGLDLPRFAQRLAYHYDNYNFIHPFREGNGRVQRLFWTLFCHDAGYDLDWRLVSGEENDEASRLAAEDQNYTMLEAIFRRIASPCDPAVPIGNESLAAGHLRTDAQ